MNWKPGNFSFWILMGHHHKRSINPFSAAERFKKWLWLVKVMLRGSFQQSALLSETLTLTFFSLSVLESQFSKHGGVRPSYGAKATADRRIPVFTKFLKVILRRIKYAGKSIWLDKAILQIFKPLKMVLCSSCDGIPLKFKNKNGQASSLPAQIIWAYYWPLLEFAGPWQSNFLANSNLC
jgi:hypothetical protein